MDAPATKSGERGEEVSEVESLIQRFSNYLSSVQRSPRTVYEYSKDLRAWASWWRKPVKAFDQDGWDDWISYLTEDRKVTGLTIRRYQSAVRRFYRFLRRRRIVTHDPSADAEPVGVVKRLPEFLTEDEVRLMYKAAKNKRQLAILELLYACGLRNQELCNFKAEDLSLTHARVMGKGQKERLIPISRQTYATIKAYVDVREGRFYLFGRKTNAQVQQSVGQRNVEQMRTAAGILKRVTPHTLRHSIATHLLARGCNLAYIQTFLGHNDIATTRIYTHIVDEQANKAILDAHPHGL